MGGSAAIGKAQPRQSAAPQANEHITAVQASGSKQRALQQGAPCASLAVKTAGAVSAGIILPRSSGPSSSRPKASSSHEKVAAVGKGVTLNISSGSTTLPAPTRHPSQPVTISNSPQTKEAENAACQERIKAWYTQLLYYKANPETLEFSYMVLTNPNSIVYKPYDLVVVPHAKVQRDFYYTMSAEGVVHFHGNETSHVSLCEFERSFFLYKQVSQMQFFAQFRLWKAFRLWCTYICRNKANKASQTLAKRLFYLHKFFGPCLQALVRTCGELDAGTTFHILSAAQPCQLGSFKVRSHFLACSHFSCVVFLLDCKQWGVDVPKPYFDSCPGPPECDLRGLWKWLKCS